MEQYYRRAHYPEALAYHKGYKRHVYHGRHAVYYVVKLREKTVRLADVAPYAAQRNADQAFAGGYYGQLYRSLRGKPYLAPVIAAKVIRAEPIFAVWQDKAKVGIRPEALIIIFAYPKRYKREYEYHEEHDHHDYGGLILEEVAENALPIRIFAVADALGFAWAVFHKREQLAFLHAKLFFKLGCGIYSPAFHYRVSPPFPVSLILGSNMVMSTSPRNRPITPKEAYRSTSPRTMGIS